MSINSGFILSILLTNLVILHVVIVDLFSDAVQQEETRPVQRGDTAGSE